MSKPSLTMRFFRTDAGNEPVREWLWSLPRKDSREIGSDIRVIQEGWPLGFPDVRKMEAGLWEVRSDIADGIARVFFTIQDGHMVLLHGFIKKGQKTPVHELATARKRKRQTERQS
jgi:phage-related protein